MPKNFIQKAIEHPGKLTERAKAAGETVAEYAAQKHDDPQIKREINLYHVLFPDAS